MVRKNKKGKSRFNLYFWSSSRIFVWIVIGLLISLQVVFTIQTSTLGATLKDIERKQSVVIEENQRLSEEVVDRTSLSDLGQKTENLGFVKPQFSFYINVDNFVAKAIDDRKN